MKYLLSCKSVVNKCWMHLNLNTVENWNIAAFLPYSPSIISMLFWIQNKNCFKEYFSDILVFLSIYLLFALFLSFWGRLCFRLHGFFPSLHSPGSSSIKWVCLGKKSFHLSEGQHAEHFCSERVSRFWFSTWLFTAVAILKAKYVPVWFFCFPLWKSSYFDELFHSIADSHLLNTHPFPLSCPCYPLLITALEMGLVPLLQRFFHADTARQACFSVIALASGGQNCLLYSSFMGELPSDDS